MNFALQGAPYNTNEDEGDELAIKKQQRKNMTLKKRPLNNTNSDVKNMIGTIHSGANNNSANNSANNSTIHNNIHSESASDEDNQLADFNPPPHPTLQPQKEQSTIPDNSNELNPNSNYHVSSIYEGGTLVGPVHTVEAFNNNNNNMGTTTYTGANNYVGPYNQQVPYYTQMSQKNGIKDPLLEKLNYMIHLLEEQQDEKTGHVMEELILYSFLGVFLIFIVDSFARAGKYTR
jgi:hypothetical protein